MPYSRGVLDLNLDIQILHDLLCNRVSKSFAAGVLIEHSQGDNFVGTTRFTGSSILATAARKDRQAQKLSLDKDFEKIFSVKPERYFSAPGRTEISGNHTDHQRGCVLAGAVNLDTVAAVRPNGTNTIRIQSKGYPMCQVCLDELEPKESEINSTPALIRGVAARFAQLGCNVEGFDAYCESTVLPGSGLSSSAAFEVLVGTVINCLFFEKKLSAIEIAQVGQYAENVFFGKPCGLMDQMASSVGGMVYIDFEKPQSPEVYKIDFDFASSGHTLCIIDTGADHADLSDSHI